MTKKQILSKLDASHLRQRLAWECPLKGHRRHDGITHFDCYNRLKGAEIEEKIAVLDIETEDLKADYGIMFCWGLYDVNEKKMYSDVLHKNDITKYASHNRTHPPRDDTRIVESLIDRLSRYDRVVTHYGCRFDISFIRTRAIICKLKFPTFGAIFQSDTWLMSRYKLRLSRNTLQNLCLKTLGRTRKDHLSHSIKHGCLRGEEWALDAAIKHCKNDVLDTKDVFPVLSPFVKQSRTSI